MEHLKELPQLSKIEQFDLSMHECACKMQMGKQTVQTLNRLL